MQADQTLTFIRHIQRGEAAAVLEMLRAHPELVNQRHADCFGATPLMHAVNSDNRTMVDLLLDHGADTSISAAIGQTARSGCSTAPTTNWPRIC